VQDLLGHADIRQSERYALAAVQEHQVAAVSALSKLARRARRQRPVRSVRFRPEKRPFRPDATAAIAKN
jgi:hypothetical protein